jgi:hypothetical protein
VNACLWRLFIQVFAFFFLRFKKIFSERPPYEVPIRFRLSLHAELFTDADASRSSLIAAFMFIDTPRYAAPISPGFADFFAAATKQQPIRSVSSLFHHACSRTRYLSRIYSAMEPEMRR